MGMAILDQFHEIIKDDWANRSSFYVAIYFVFYLMSVTLLIYKVNKSHKILEGPAANLARNKASISKVRKDILVLTPS